MCAGLARIRGTGAGWIRVGFVASALIGGLGILVYFACWLIIPREGEPTERRDAGWIVFAAQACVACVGVVVLGALGAAATLFGFGWIVAGLGAAVLLGVLVSWPRLSPAWALLPIAALTLPSLAVAAGGLQLSLQAGHETVAPRALSQGRDVTLRAGLGTMLVDLRRTALPSSGVVALTIEAGLRRTVVALPNSRCVHVALRYDVRPFVAQAASQLTGELPFSGVELFGDVVHPSPGINNFPQGAAAGPWLRIEFTSLGGSLYVRDYPDRINPDAQPYWPGFRVHPEPRPSTKGIPRRVARRLIAAWRVRRVQQVRSKRLVDALLPGPCAAAGAVR